MMMMDGSSRSSSVREREGKNREEVGEAEGSKQGKKNRGIFWMQAEAGVGGSPNVT
jgi:hypothetical protein